MLEKVGRSCKTIIDLKVNITIKLFLKLHFVPLFLICLIFQTGKIEFNWNSSKFDLDPENWCNQSAKYSTRVSTNFKRSGQNCWAQVQWLLQRFDMLFCWTKHMRSMLIFVRFFASKNVSNSPRKTYKVLHSTYTSLKVLKWQENCFL